MPLYRFDGLPYIGQKPVEVAVQRIFLWGTNPRAVSASAKRIMIRRGGFVPNYLGADYPSAIGVAQGPPLWFLEIQLPVPADKAEVT